jgi:hypothetical protein
MHIDTVQNRKNQNMVTASDWTMCRLTSVSIRALPADRYTAWYRKSQIVRESDASPEIFTVVA